MKHLVVALISLSLAGCGGGGGASETVLVSAAASLTDAFADIEVAFEAANPDLDVVLNLGGSSTLREQILAGAPADVFASADSVTMDRLLAAGRVAGPRVFAGNRLEIATPAGNPAGVAGLEDFAEPSLLLGVCAPAASCGAMANLLFGAARITPSIDTEEPNVRALLTKITSGELDAGIVYATDVLAAAGDVTGIEIPDDRNVFTDYPVAVVSEAPNPEGAEAFVAFVLSPQGQQILADRGFLTYD